MMAAGHRMAQYSKAIHGACERANAPLKTTCTDLPSAASIATAARKLPLQPSPRQIEYTRTT